MKVNPGEVTEHVCKLAKKGLTPSQIGVILRDSHGIAQVAHVTGSKILRILKKNGAQRTLRAAGQSSSCTGLAVPQLPGPEPPLSPHPMLHPLMRLPVWCAFLG